MKRPLVPVALALVAGIAAGGCVDFRRPTVIAAMALGAVVLVAAAHRWARPLKWVVALAALAAIYGGWAESGREFRVPEKGSLEDYADAGRVSLQGVVVDSPEPRENGARLSIEASRIVLAADAYVPVRGRMVLTVKEGGGDFRVGDVLRFTVRPHRIAPLGNPGSFRLDRHFRAEGVTVTGVITRAESVSVLSRGGAPAWKRAVGEARRSIGRAIDAACETPERQVIRSVVLGESASLPADVRRLYRDAGVSHILAISGMHMGVVAAAAFSLVFLLLRQTGRLLLHINAVKWTAAVTAVPVAAYALLAGTSPSVVRSAVMVLVYLAAILVDRRRDIFSAIALAAILILTGEPDALYDVGFQLSFAAVIGIVTLVPPFVTWRTRRRSPLEQSFPSPLRRLTDAVVLALSTTVAAWWVTAPITAEAFNGVSLVSVAANLVVVPIFTLLVIPVSLLASLVSFVSPGVAGVLFAPVRYALFTAHHLAALFAAVPGAYLRLPSPNVFEWISWFAVPSAFLVFRKTRARVAVAAIAAAVLVASPIWTIRAARLHDALRLSVIDVGQGLSQLIEFPDGTRALDDGGGHWGPEFDVGERIIAPCLWNARIFSIDRVIASHPDSDHYGGLEFVVRHFGVGELWVGGFDEAKQSDAYRALLSAARERGIPIRVVDRDTPVMHAGAAAMAVIWPPAGEATRAKDNVASTVLRVTYGKTAFLLPADIPDESEARLLNSDVFLSADVLVPSHHGAPDGSSAAFLNAVKPRYAIISAGRANRYGHPSPTVLERLTAVGATVLRTDRDGMVRCLSDGATVNCQPALARRGSM